MRRLTPVMTAALGLLLLAGWAAPPDGGGGGFNPFGGLGGAAPEAQFSDSRAKVTVTARAQTPQVRQGGDVAIAVIFEIAPGWHVWTDDRVVPEGIARFEDAEFTKITATAPDDGRLEIHDRRFQWPGIHEFESDQGDGLQTYLSFDGRSIAYLPVTVPEDAPLGATSVDLEVYFQSCDASLCLQPASVNLTVDLEIVPREQSTALDTDDDFLAFDLNVWEQIRAGIKPPDVLKFDLFGIVSFTLDASTGVGFILVLLAAALGGFILNLTPCVLPVIPIKIMSLSQSAGNRRRTFLLGVVMFLGIVAFWFGLGIAIAVVASFTATNQLFQYPLFTIGVGLFIAIMAVGMCGVFSLRLPSAVYSVSPKLESAPGSFIFGAMVAVLSTPCTAPFMGVAAAWAALQSIGVTLAAFSAIGIGMALPYLVLAAFPGLVRKMPRTGPASEVIKQVMGLLMLAAAAYFCGVGVSGLLAKPIAPPSRLYFWFVALFSLMAGAWIVYRTFQITPSALRRVVFGGFGAFVIAVSVFIGVRLTDKGPIDWVYYTHDRFAEATSNGNVVVMEFTAEWCLNCKALEQTVLRRPEIVELFHSEGVIPIKVDITSKRNVEGTEMLKSARRLTIPLLIVFDPSGDEVFKSDAYTANQVIEAINGVRGTRVARN